MEIHTPGRVGVNKLFLPPEPTDRTREKGKLETRRRTTSGVGARTNGTTDSKRVSSPGRTEERWDQVKVSLKKQDNPRHTY